MWRQRFGWRRLILIFLKSLERCREGFAVALGRLLQRFEYLLEAAGLLRDRRLIRNKYGMGQRELRYAGAVLSHRSAWFWMLRSDRR